MHKHSDRHRASERAASAEETQDIHCLDPITPIPMRPQPAVEKRDPESANYRKDSREWGNRAILLVLTAAGFLALMVLHHEVLMTEMNFKIGLILKALKIDMP